MTEKQNAGLLGPSSLYMLLSTECVYDSGM